MSITPGLEAYRLAFQISPIILTGAGIVPVGVPGGMLPLIAITEAINFPDGLLSGGKSIEGDNFFAHFTPVPGGTLINQDLGRYPFANQAVAANAVIQQPLTISMEMMTPVRDTLGYAARLAIMIALQAALAQHNATGGTYTIATPSYIYTNCIMRTFRDVSNNQTKQVQNTWQMDFEQPLITLAAAQQAQSGLVQILSGLYPSGSLQSSGLFQAIGNIFSSAAPATMPVATAGVASSVAGAGSSPAVIAAFNQ